MTSSRYEQKALTKNRKNLHMLMNIFLLRTELSLKHNLLNNWWNCKNKLCKEKFLCMNKWSTSSWRGCRSQTVPLLLINQEWVSYSIHKSWWVFSRSLSEARSCIRLTISTTTVVRGLLEVKLTVEEGSPSNRSGQVRTCARFRRQVTWTIIKNLCNNRLSTVVLHRLVPEELVKLLPLLILLLLPKSFQVLRTRLVLTWIWNDPFELNIKWKISPCFSRCLINRSFEFICCWTPCETCNRWALTAYDVIIRFVVLETTLHLLRYMKT